MAKVELKIQNGVGIHARPASQIVNAATKFQSSITIEYKEKKINAKSMMSVLASGIKQDEPFVLLCEGVDEQIALQTLEALIGNIKE